MNGSEMDDVAEARQLLRQLDTEPRHPSRVDLDRIVVDGRRRLRVRVMAIGASVAVAAVLLAGVGLATLVRHTGTAPSVAVLDTPSPSPAVTPPPAPTGCVGQALPMPPNHKSVMVMGTDPTGRYLVGRSMDKVGRNHPLLWTDGALTVLDPKGSDGDVDGIAVTSSGLVVWSSSSASPTGYRESMWRWEAGKVTKLDNAAGYRVMALGEDGTVLAVDQGLGTPTRAAPGEWRARLLTLPLDDRPADVRDLQATDAVGQVKVAAVDRDGTAVGIADYVTAGPPSVGPAHAASWPASGGMRQLSAPDDPGMSTRAVAVSGDWAVGMAGDVKSGPARSVRWDLRDGTAQWVHQMTLVTAVNRYGWMTGLVTDGRRTGVLLTGDQAVPLPTPPGIPAGIPLTPAVLSDNGRTVGAWADLGDSPVAVRWSCS